MHKKKSKILEAVQETAKGLRKAGAIDKMPLTLYGIERLSADERLMLISELWESLDDESVSLTPAQQEELDRRLSLLDSDQARSVTWGSLKMELQDKVARSNRRHSGADTVAVTLRPPKALLQRYVHAAAERTQQAGRVVSAQEVMLDQLARGPRKPA